MKKFKPLSLLIHLAMLMLAISVYLDGGGVV
jgi:hypothetical protein